MRIMLVAGTRPNFMKVAPILFELRHAESFGLRGELAALRTLEPFGYADMLSPTDGAVCLTDSGGVQEETTVLGVPCVTLREQTERPSTIEFGSNRLGTWPLTRDGVLRAFECAREQGRVDIGSRVPEGWDGKAAVRIRRTLEDRAAFRP